MLSWLNLITCNEIIRAIIKLLLFILSRPHNKSKIYNFTGFSISLSFNKLLILHEGFFLKKNKKDFYPLVLVSGMTLFALMALTVPLIWNPWSTEKWTLVCLFPEFARSWTHHRLQTLCKDKIYATLRHFTCAVIQYPPAYLNQWL